LSQQSIKRKLGYLSGSSGKLVVQSPKAEPVFADYPGTVFADENLSYPEAMIQFVAASEAKLTNREIDIHTSEPSQQRADKQALRQEQEALRVQRRQQRQLRQQEDAAFKSLKAERRAQQQRRKAKIKNQRPEWGSKKVADEHWKAIRLGRCSGIELPWQRQAQSKQRQQENQQWRKQRESLRLRLDKFSFITAWIAILVITLRQSRALLFADNCTRQCYGRERALPAF